jgi:hypothetical protein
MPETSKCAKAAGEKPLPGVAATIISGMKPQTIGRALGIGIRVAGRVVGQRLAESAQAPAAAQPQPVRNAAIRANSTTMRSAGQVLAQGSGGVAKGVGGFLRPFRRVGRILWLEVTGAFFLLPVVAFTPNLWRMRASWAHGPDHSMFLITAGVVLLFLYLGTSSFWRARRRAARD